MLLCHVGQAHARQAVMHNRRAVYGEWRAAYATTLQFGSTHSGLHPFNDETFFQFCDCPDNYDHRTSQWTASVDVFAQAYKLDSEVIQFVKHFQEVTNTPGNSVESCHEYDVKFPSQGIHEKSLEARSFGFCAGYDICEFPNDFKSSLFSQQPKVIELCFWMLVPGADTRA